MRTIFRFAVIQKKQEELGFPCSSSLADGRPCWLENPSQSPPEDRKKASCPDKTGQWPLRVSAVGQKRCRTPAAKEMIGQFIFSKATKIGGLVVETT